MTRLYRFLSVALLSPLACSLSTANSEYEEVEGNGAKGAVTFTMPRAVGVGLPFSFRVDKSEQLRVPRCPPSAQGCDPDPDARKQCQTDLHSVMRSARVTCDVGACELVETRGGEFRFIALREGPMTLRAHVEGTNGRSWDDELVVRAYRPSHIAVTHETWSDPGGVAHAMLVGAKSQWQIEPMLVTEDGEVAAPNDGAWLTVETTGDAAKFVLEARSERAKVAAAQAGTTHVVLSGPERLRRELDVHVADVSQVSAVEAWALPTSDRRDAYRVLSPAERPSAFRDVAVDPFALATRTDRITLIAASYEASPYEGALLLHLSDGRTAVGGGDYLWTERPDIATVTPGHGVGTAEPTTLRFYVAPCGDEGSPARTTVGVDPKGDGGAHDAAAASDAAAADGGVDAEGKDAAADADDGDAGAAHDARREASVADSSMTCSSGATLLRARIGDVELRVPTAVVFNRSR